MAIIYLKWDTSLVPRLIQHTGIWYQLFMHVQIFLYN